MGVEVVIEDVCFYYHYYYTFISIFEVTRNTAFLKDLMQ